MTCCRLGANLVSEDFGIELLQIAIAKSISEQFTSARGARIKAAQTTDSRSVSTSSRLPVSAEFSVEKKLVAIIEHSYNRQLHMGNEEKKNSRSSQVV